MSVPIIKELFDITISPESEETYTLNNIPVDGSTMYLHMSIGSSPWITTFVVGTPRSVTAQGTGQTIRYDGSHTFQFVGAMTGGYVEYTGRVYGIASDKSLVEINSNDNLIILEGVIEDVPSRGTVRTRSWTAADLGVSNLNDVIPISIAQAVGGGTTKQYKYANSMSLVSGEGSAITNNNYPLVFISGSLILNVINPNETQDETNDIYYQVVLMKIR